MSIAITVGESVIASPSPRCELRQLVVHVYPGGIKAHDAERLTVFYGRRGRPVKKPRFIPAETHPTLLIWVGRVRPLGPLDPWTTTHPPSDSILASLECWLPRLRGGEQARSERPPPLKR